MYVYYVRMCVVTVVCVYPAHVCVCVSMLCMHHTSHIILHDNVPFIHFHCADIITLCCVCRPMYIDSTNNMPDTGDQTVAKLLRESLEDLLVVSKK